MCVVANQLTDATAKRDDTVVVQRHTTLWRDQEAIHKRVVGRFAIQQGVPNVVIPLQPCM